MMKKVYEKPQIMFESFELSSSVAAGCELVTNLPAPMTCGYPYGREKVVFVNESTGCQFVPDDGMYNGYCYHAPTDNNNLFNS
jgi:hypothetical protein